MDYLVEFAQMSTRCCGQKAFALSCAWNVNRLKLFWISSPSSDVPQRECPSETSSELTATFETPQAGPDKSPLILLTQVIGCQPPS